MAEETQENLERAYNEKLIEAEEIYEKLFVDLKRTNFESIRELYFKNSETPPANLNLHWTRLSHNSNILATID